MFYFFKKYFFNLVTSCIFLATDAEAVDDGQKFPSLFSVYQQQGPTCPYISFENLKKIRGMRERDPERKIALQDSDYVTKVQSYAWFLPRIRALDCAYDTLRMAGGSYAGYEQAIRSQGIKSDRQYDKRGKPVDRIDRFSTDQARRKNYTPYNIKVEESPYYGMRWLPLFHTDDDQFYFYDHTSKEPIKLKQIGPSDMTEIDHTLYLSDGTGKCSPAMYRFEDGTLEKMGISRSDMNRLVMSSPFLGSKTAYYLQSSSEGVYSQEVFYNVGTYQHILFACGLNRNNEDFTDEDDEWAPYKEFHGVFENPLNPWGTIHKNDLFEYHLANIFRTYPNLKEIAQQAANYYNHPWRFYQESFELYDNPQEPRAKLSYKQKYLPGEDQMLAYFMSSQLRFTWAASISLEALIAIEELDEELGKNTVKALKAFSFLPGIPSVANILDKASQKKFRFEGKKYSFLDAWEAIKGQFIESVINPSQTVDFVSFSGHGCVISFDADLVQLQRHNNRTVADRLGFEMWDSLYEKGIRPFYQKPGTEADLVICQ